MPGPGASARVPFVGLTGGLGAGKSTALDLFAELGAATLSADAVVHELLESPDVCRKIAERLGDDVLVDGELDRTALAGRIFDRPQERDWLEALLWPLVGERIAAWRAEIESSPVRPRLAVVEVPLLFEADMGDEFDLTIAVLAADEARFARAAQRGHAAVSEREARQLPQDEKGRRATHAVRNDGTREELKVALSRLVATMEQEA